MQEKWCGGKFLMTIKDMLLNLGMLESELDNHYSDLYVKYNLISENFILANDIKATTFICQRDNELWYDIPFGYMSEYIQGKMQDRGVL
jgi:hypothetical protein